MRAAEKQGGPASAPPLCSLLKHGQPLSSFHSHRASGALSLSTYLLPPNAQSVVDCFVQSRNEL
eukprot:5080801-Prymnesium_polylepis.1